MQTGSTTTHDIRQTITLPPPPEGAHLIPPPIPDHPPIVEPVAGDVDERRARRARRIRATKGSEAVLATANRITGRVREHLVRSGWHPDGWVVVVTPEGEERQQPEWYVNIRAGAKAVIVDGAERHVVRARETRGPERAKLWKQMSRLDPRLGEQAPLVGSQVLVLERIGVFASR